VALLKREVTQALAAANQANGRKAKGPVTEEGKSVSRLNAGKHWGRAECIRDLLPTLGERAEELDAVRDGLYRALQPRDEFEALLVDDMVEIHWRLRRQIRAEASYVAAHRRERMAEADELAAKMDAGRLHELEPYVASALGLAGLKDSPPKFFRILELLTVMREVVREQGFAGQYAIYLQTIYGKEAGIRGRNLTQLYRTCVKEQESGNDADRKLNLAMFFHELDAEIAWFEARAASDRQARAELVVPRREAELLKSKLDPDKVMRYQERLERRFERKWKLLMSHRRACQAAEAREALAGGQALAASEPAEESPSATPGETPEPANR